MISFIYHRSMYGSCRNFQFINSIIYNRLYSSVSSTLEQFTKFQELANRWPSDTCNRKKPLKEEIQRRITECLSMPIDKVDINFWEAEYQSLSRLFNNYHQDNYRLPSGLGDNRKERYIPLIAATGGNLNECRRILQESEAMEKSWTVRILSKILT